MTKTPAYEIQVCTDCTQSHANGDTGGNEPDCKPWALWTGEDITMGSFGPCTYGCEQGEECNCDQIGFTWRNCEGCGSTLGGYRHVFTVWE